MKSPIDLFESLFSDGHAKITATGIYLVIRSLAQTRIAQTRVFKRLQKFLPYIFGVAAVLLGSVPVVESSPLLAKCGAGMIVGFIAHGAHKLLGLPVAAAESIAKRKAKEDDPD